MDTAVLAQMLRIAISLAFSWEIRIQSAAAAHTTLQSTDVTFLQC